mmetsp:Transcript_15053/g.37085  ORF Transcript_15053/g.37085 Transcript_15053/m.37085 type:complete len:227 (+) Transcript_15053:305-985(+)
MKRFIAMCAQKMILDQKWKEPVTWMASLGKELNFSSIPNPYDFPALIVAHRREKRKNMWLKYSQHDSQQRWEPGKFHQLLMKYGCLSSDCEMSRFRLEQSLCVCENNINMGGSSTRWWARARQEVTVEIETLNVNLAAIMSMFEGKKRSEQAEIISSRKDVENFLMDKVIEEKQQSQEQQVVGDNGADKDPYDGDEDDYDYDDDHYDDLDYFDSKVSSSSRNRKKG